MDHHPYCRPLPATWRALVLLVMLALMMVAGSSCETSFQENPEAHRLLKELEKWPDDYYWLIETGTSSRVMGIRAQGESVQQALTRIDALLTRVKEQWSRIGALHTAPELVEYFRQHDLDPIAEAIEATLAQNQSQMPAGELNLQLQAMAIKRGLMVAYREIQHELNR